MDKANLERKYPTVKKSPFGIFVDQAGYFPDAVKKAVMAFPCEDFSVVDESGNIRFEGKAAPSGYDKYSGDTVYIADFSGLTEEGSFRVVSGEERSALFTVGKDAYRNVLGDITKAFYYFRCGCGLEEPHAGVYAHKKCHTAPALLWEDKQTSLDVSGGWHDAGDYGRYVTPGAVAAAHLLYAYRLFPEVFGALSLDIPESVGDIPDILAECRNELLWLLKMQREDGGVYHKATTQTHAPFVMPEDDTAQMYVFPVSSMAAADLAAVCALAAGVYEKYDTAFAETLSAAAKKSCEWLENNPDFIGFTNPEGCNTGPYWQSGDSSNRFWAYAEMYALTGDEKWHSKMKAEMKAGFPPAALGYVETGGLGALSYLLCSRRTDDELRSRFEQAFIAEAQRLRECADRCGYGCAMEDYDFHWGSNMIVLQHGMVFAICDAVLCKSELREYAAAQLHYLLGVNALGYSYVTGSGEFRCNYPHLRPAQADSIDECIPGMVSGGPNRIPMDEDAKILIPEGTPPMKCYADDVRCYSLNEVTIYWNSPAVFLLGYLLDTENNA